MGNPLTYRTLRAHPFRVLLGPLPWAALAYGLSGMVLAAPTVVLLALFPLLPAWSWLLSTVERQRVRLIGHKRVPGPPAQLRVPPWQNASARLVSALGWREVANTLVHLVFAVLTLALWVFALTLACTLLFAPFLPLIGRVFAFGEWRIDSPIGITLLALLGVATLALFLYAQLLLALGQAMTTRVLIGSRIEELQGQVTTLAGERIALVDAFEAERRRIERDLHDGPQQHLAGAALHLGLLRTRIQASANGREEELLPNLDAAHNEIERALDAIRAAVSGLRPRILIEEGLSSALTHLAERSPIPTTVTFGSHARLHDTVEASVYSIATEFVANSLKHSKATRITMALDPHPDGIHILLSDNGCGGADSTQGTGLIGIQHRARLLGGTTHMRSPTGGPTTFSLVLPHKTIRTETTA